MNEVSIKEVQSSFQKIITWTKKNENGQHEWAKACRYASFHPQK
jgi:hypothetical protein